MKFSEIGKEEWTGLQQYLDTCLLPITGMTGAEQPWQATERLEALRDWLDYVEQPFKGRVVTYPAMHYMDHVDLLPSMVRVLAGRLRESGFKYIVIVTPDSEVARQQGYDADLIISPELKSEGTSVNVAASVSARIRQLWSGDARV